MQLYIELCIYNMLFLQNFLLRKVVSFRSNKYIYIYMYMVYKTPSEQCHIIIHSVMANYSLNI